MMVSTPEPTLAIIMMERQAGQRTVPLRKRRPRFPSTARYPPCRGPRTTRFQAAYGATLLAPLRGSLRSTCPLGRSREMAERDLAVSQPLAALIYRNFQNFLNVKFKRSVLPRILKIIFWHICAT